MIVGSVHLDVFIDVRSKSLTNCVIHIFRTTSTKQVVGEIGMHTRTVPIGCPEWFTMPVDSNAIFFSGTFHQIPCYPYLVSSCFSAFCKDLKFPLASRYFRIDTFNVDPCFKAKIKMLFYNIAAKSILRTYGTIVWALWCWISACRKAQRFVGFRIPQEVLLLKSEPEIIIIIFNRSPSVGDVWRRVRV